jgi:hypothetical protein
MANGDTARSEGAQVQPDRRRAGAAVEGEGDRSGGGGVGRVGAGVGHEEDVGQRLAFLLLHHDGAGRGGVANPLAVDGDSILRADQVVLGRGGELVLARFGFRLLRFGADGAGRQGQAEKGQGCKKPFAHRGFVLR